MFALLLTFSSSLGVGENMNGEYIISPTPNAKPGKYNTKWSEYKNQGTYAYTLRKDAVMAPPTSTPHLKIFLTPYSHLIPSTEGGVESFDVYMGPIKHLYSEVFWTELPEVPLPDGLIERFAGKGMAIIGYEVDQVRKGAGPNGEDVGVSINMAYNHHHDANIVGAGSSMERVRYDPLDVTVSPMARADPNYMVVAVEHTPSPNGLPTSAHLAAGNGGEYRKSYHGFASPVAYVIESPQNVHVLPMQIDTWNRDKMNISGGSKFVPGPHPKHSLAPTDKNALYSGLLECPLTDRVQKIIPGGTGFNSTYALLIADVANVPQCGGVKPKPSPTTPGIPLLGWYSQANEDNVLSTAAFSPGAGYKSDGTSLGSIYATGTAPKGTDVSLMKLWKSTTGKLDHFTTVTPLEEKLATQANYTLVGVLGETQVGSSPEAGSIPVNLFYCEKRNDHFMSTNNCAACGGLDYVNMNPGGGRVDGSLLPPRPPAPAPQMTQCAHVIATTEECFNAARHQPGLKPNAKVTTSSGSSEDVASGCTLSVDPVTGSAKAFFNTNVNSTACCGAGVETLLGSSTSSLVHLALAVHGGSKSVEITMSAPSNGGWFGVGFFAQAMVETPYAIIIDGNGTVTERKLANHGAGTLLKTSVKVISSSVANGRRTVVMTRPSAGATKDHASFEMNTLSVPFINAVGASNELAYHSKKTAATLALWPMEAGKSSPASACVCEQPAAPFGSAKGNLKYLPTGEEYGFVNYCDPMPRESVLFNRNPTCDVRKYVGGLQVCKHMFSLLDSDQEQPWPNQPLVYYQKYRFYFQEYKPDFHVVSVPRQGWGIAAAGGHAEYDVPQCPPGTPREKCTHMIWGVLTPTGHDLHLAAIHFHCHGACPFPVSFLVTLG